MRLGHRVILALDVTDPSRARSIARAVKSDVDAIKVGWATLLSGGTELIRELAGLGYLLADMRTAEIPNTTRLIVEQVAALGASGIVTQGFVGEDSVRAAVDAAGPGAVFVITEVSPPGGAQFNSPHAEEMARIAVRAAAARVGGAGPPPGRGT